MKGSSKEEFLLRKVRFAPAPTGELHVGHLWTCYLNSKKGPLTLRIDNTNSTFNELEIERFKSECVKLMDVFGINFSDVIVQSERSWLHKRYSKLIRETYWEDNALKLSMRGQASFYDNYREKWLFKKVPYDPTLIRSNGMPTYHLASAVDDVSLGITDVVRSSDHLDNSHVHAKIFESLGYKVRLWHCPLIYSSEGDKLSKSKGAVSLKDILSEGILPVTLLTYFDKHMHSINPFRFDFDYLRNLNRTFIKDYDYVISTLSKVNDYLRYPLNPYEIYLARDLLLTGRYATLESLAVSLRPLIDRLRELIHDRDDLSLEWRECLEYILSDRKNLSLIRNMSNRDKDFFRIKVLRMSKVPNLTDVLGILFELYNGCSKEENI